MDFQFFKTPRETWDGMRADIQAARKSVEFEQYIIANDDVGNGFLRLFLDKQRAGVQVRLLLDRVGSRGVYGSALVKQLEEAGAQVRFYNPPLLKHIFMPARWFPRNHTKTLLIDSEIAWIGGVCCEAGMANWRDSQVRFTGPAVALIEEKFHLERIRWTKRFKRFAKRDRDQALPFDYIVHRPHLGPNPIYRRLVRAIRESRVSVDLVTPYFLPPFGLRRAIRRAAKRGVRVRVMMSEATDAPLADRVSHSYFPWMYRKGIRIYLYRKSMLHAKYAIIDDAWATMGSSNMDYLSLKHNREANIIIHDAAIIAKMREQFDSDLNDCIEAGKDYWHSLSLRHRIMGYLGRVMKKVL